MILPILISVSLAPGSYLFCALAAVATNADGERGQGRKILPTQRHRFLPIAFFNESCSDQVSQAASALASMCLFRVTKQTVVEGWQLWSGPAIHHLLAF
jgi:hypothetical protein